MQKSEMPVVGAAVTAPSTQTEVAAVITAASGKFGIG